VCEVNRPTGFRRIGEPNCSLCREVFQVCEYEAPEHYYCMLGNTCRRPSCGSVAMDESDEFWTEDKTGRCRLREEWETWSTGRSTSSHHVCDLFKEIPKCSDDLLKFDRSVVYTHHLDRWTRNVACFIHVSDFEKYYSDGGPGPLDAPDGRVVHLLPFSGGPDVPLPPELDFGVPMEKLHATFVEMRDGYKLPPEHFIALNELIAVAKESK
jgi:hypothetical protein